MTIKLANANYSHSDGGKVTYSVEVQIVDDADPNIIYYKTGISAIQHLQDAKWMANLKTDIYRQAMTIKTKYEAMIADMKVTFPDVNNTLDEVRDAITAEIQTKVDGG